MTSFKTLPPPPPPGTQTGGQTGPLPAARPSSFEPQTVIDLEETRMLEWDASIVREQLALIIREDPAGASLSKDQLAKTVDEVMKLKTLPQVVNEALSARSPTAMASPDTVARLETAVIEELPVALVKANLVDIMRADFGFGSLNEGQLNALANQLLTLDSVAAILGRALSP